MNKFHIKIRVNTVDDRLSSDLKREIDTVGVGRRGVVEEVAARADGVRSQSGGAIVVARGGQGRQGRQTRQGRQGPGRERQCGRGAQRGRRQGQAGPRRHRRRAQAAVLHHAHVVQQKTYLSLEGGVDFVVERGVRGRVRGRRRRPERGQLALEERNLPLQGSDARLLGLQHGRERGACAAARQAGRGQSSLQLHLERPQRVRRRLQLLPVECNASRSAAAAAAAAPTPTAAPLDNNLPTTDVSSRAAWGCVPSNCTLLLLGLTRRELRSEFGWLRHYGDNDALLLV